MTQSWLTRLLRQKKDNAHKKRYETFRYDTLTDNGSFRVVILLPGKYQDGLQCDFKTYQVSSPPEYEALSYVWGTQSRAIPLLSDGKQIFITGTLDLALRRLRNPHSSRVLWIDQLCINQDDLDERSQQVQLMRYIYSNARRVLVWLGSDDNMQAKRAKELISTISKVWHIRIGSSYFPKNEDLELQGLPLREAPVWQDLEQMFGNPYFERIWVVQECRVASNLLILWGTEEISWTEFSHTVHWSQEHYASYPDTDGLGSPMLGIMPLALTTPNNTVDYGLNLLLFTRSHKASDPRDKVYALLGLLRRDCQSLKPDYRKSAPEVFAGFVRHMMPRLSTLEILSYVHLTSLTELPLWAPRWALNEDNVGSLEGCTFKASGATKPRYKDSSLWGLLDLEGLLLDRVNCTTQSLSERPTATKQGDIQDACELALSTSSLGPGPYQELICPIVPLVWTLTAGQTTRLGHLTDQAADATHLLDFAAYLVNILILHMKDVATEPRCMRVVLNIAIEAQNAYLQLEKNLDSSMQAKALSEESKVWFENFMRVVHSQNDPGCIASSARHLFERIGLDGNKSARFQMTLVRTYLDRKFFITDQGYMGIGAHLMEAGDRVCVLFGGSTPYIVRPTSVPDEYLFLGECYVHGLMDGEAIKLWEEGKVQSQRFQLR
jgi:hypothetical protein